jgi:hypothetical protein
VSDELHSLQRRLDNARENLRLVQVRISEYAEPEHVPLQYKKNVEHWEKEIARLEQEIAALGSAPPSSDSSGSSGSTIFDQRGQQVSGSQYNAAGDINIGQPPADAQPPAATQIGRDQFNAQESQGAISNASGTVIQNYYNTPEQPPADAPADEQRREPKTWIVDQFPTRGDFTTIAEAIEAAQPGARILVRPGYYSEALVLDKPLEIVGDGEREEIVVEATAAPALTFQTTVGRVAHLTLRSLAQDTAPHNRGCVYITQGRLTLEYCDISSEIDIGVVIINPGTNPLLRSNRIHGVSYAVSVHSEGRGTFIENDLRCNSGGIWNIADNCLSNVRRKGNNDDGEPLILWG